MNFKKIRTDLLNLIENRPWIVFIILFATVILTYRSLFNSYFEADEWFHFTYYLPLVGKPDGLSRAVASAFFDTGILTGSQHVSPIATAILFLSVKFFGLHFVPYAFITLTLHALNSFLVFVFIKLLLYTRKQAQKNIFALLSAIFFAFVPGPAHTITGAAPFYSYNVLSVTFFLISIISFKTAFIKGQKKFVYASAIFLFLALFSKETSAFLFLLLPFMAIIEKRIFSYRFLGKIFVFSLLAYVIFRFALPNVYILPKVVSNLAFDFVSVGQVPKTEVKVEDTGTIVSRDLSIHKNLGQELLFRTVTFPIKIAGTLFLPRQNVQTFVGFITPIVQPVPPGGDSAEESQSRLGFFYGTGNAFIIYLVSIGIFIFCLRQILGLIKSSRKEEARSLATGLAIIVFSALPLVAIIFAFPRWGYDYYFDSRHYYNPAVGGAIIFPFLIIGIADYLSKILNKKSLLNPILILLFALWFINNMVALEAGIRQFTKNYQPDRRMVVEQLKVYLPTLPKNAVFYFETNEKSAYGPNLPFQTSVPQAIALVYFENSPLPDSFFSNPLFGGKKEGFQSDDGRGFGYYTSKYNLSKDLAEKKFDMSDVYAFYYKADEVRLLDITSRIRTEMEEYLVIAKENSRWKSYQDNLLKIKFLYPPEADVVELQNVDPNISRSIMLNESRFNAKLSFIRLSPSFDVGANIQFMNTLDSNIPTPQVLEKEVSFDKYRINKVMQANGDQSKYFMRLGDVLIYLKIDESNAEGLKLIERILGSFKVIDE